MLTLVVKIGKLSDDQQGYPISLHKFDPDDELLEQEILPRSDAHAVISTVDRVLADESADEEALLVAGRQLYALLLQTSVGRRWKRACNEADEQVARVPGIYLRTYFDIEPAALSKMPWELMRTDSRPVFASEGHRVLRGCPMTHARTQVTSPPPIRVLVVMCESQPAAESEVYAIYSGLARPPGIWQVEVLREPAKEAFLDRLAEFIPQILHVVGGARTAHDSPGFWVERPGGQRWWLAMEDIAGRPSDSPPPPPMLIISACHAGQLVLPWRLRQRGTRAVVAMRPDLRSYQPGELTRTFYEQLTRKGSLEEAIWATRDRFFEREPDAPPPKHRKPPQEIEQREHERNAEWARVVLTVYGSPSDLVWSNLATLGAKVQSLKGWNRYRQIGLLVDRIQEHITVWGEKPGHPDRKVIVLYGGPKAGKSELIRSCMLTWELRDVRAVLVDMQVPGERVKLNTPAALRHMYRTLRDHLAELEVPSGDLATEIGHELGAMSEALNGADGRVRSHYSDPYETEFDALRGMLAKIAGDRPLLLMIDHMDMIMLNDRHWFVVKLLAPIARGGAEGINLDNVYAIAAGTTELNGASGQEWPPSGNYLDGSVERIEVTLFPGEKTGVLFREFGARKNLQEQDWCAHIRTLEGRRDDWSPTILHEVASVYEWTRR